MTKELNLLPPRNVWHSIALLEILDYLSHWITLIAYSETLVLKTSTWFDYSNVKRVGI